ncbi:MAG: nucleoside-diphosphate kinase [Rhizobiales bacterium]|nr:nucleoside-diphosphate kinase [Hyphomicrobiales bacterium]
MSATRTCQLTTKDLAILEVMLERHGHDDAFECLLRRKIRGAWVVFRDDIAPGVVTLNSRIAYRIDDGPVTPGLIVQAEGENFPGSALSLRTLRGLALLGLAEGESIEIARPAGGQERLSVTEVIFQPEAASRASARRSIASRPSVLPFRARAAPSEAVHGPSDDDEPGPAAA